MRTGASRCQAFDTAIRRRLDGHDVAQRVPGCDLHHPGEHHGAQRVRRLSGRRGRRGLAFAGIAVAAAALAGAAYAFFTSTDASNPGAAVADSIQTGNTPTLGSVSGSNVTLNWTATTTASGAAVTGYAINRYSVFSGGTPTAAGGGCAATVTATTC